jgi:hypothetical protein
MTDILPKDVLIFRRVESVFTGPSLLIKFRGRADEIVDEIAEALKETGWNWKSSKANGFFRYGHHEFSFNVGKQSWTLYVSVLGHLTDEPVKGIYVKIDLFIEKPDFRPIYVVFWPDKVRKSEISLRELVLSVVRGLKYIAYDSEQFRDLVWFMDHGNILLYHDKRRLTRADIVMRRKNVPYDFVVTYHFTEDIEHSIVVPKVSVCYGIVARGKADFDVLSEAIIDEYEFIGGGGKGD